AGDHAVLLVVERRLQPDRHGFLADVEVAEAADQPETVELAGLFLEAADQQHPLVERQQPRFAGLVASLPLEGLLEAAKLKVSARFSGRCGRVLRRWLARLACRFAGP